ncbi:hypothetical protein GCM10010381_32840 [Streptomyces xantholiticus]|nr:hypothetical protein GCM10010381_32840 [Streptomyces xantholiticus]
MERLIAGRTSQNRRSTLEESLDHWRDATGTLPGRAAPLVAFLDRTDKPVPVGQELALGDFEPEEALGRILAEENAG